MVVLWGNYEGIPQYFAVVEVIDKIFNLLYFTSLMNLATAGRSLFIIEKKNYMKKETLALVVT